MPTSVTPTIPGVSSSYQTDKMIEDLMKLERVPLEKKQQKIETLQDSKKSWLRINAQLSRLESAGKALYGHEIHLTTKVPSPLMKVPLVLMLHEMHSCKIFLSK